MQAQQHKGTHPLFFYRSAPPERPMAAELPREEAEAAGGRAKKTFIRRHGDRSQQIRLWMQVAFGAITLISGLKFYLWVRYYETAGATLQVSRPAGVEAWLPIAALMKLKAFVLTGELPVVHPAGLFLLVAFLAIALLYRKAFCSWICPIGTLSEWLWQWGQAVFGRTFALPRWFDIPLRSLKYILFGLFAWVIFTMPVPEIQAFLHTPYGLISDVKMLDFFRRMGQATAITLMVLIVLSVFVKNFWCRFLCPYGAMLGLVALVSPARIRRNADACIDCSKCAKACPAGLPVARQLSIASAECTACMSCVAACPAVGALDLSIGPRRAAAPTTPEAVAAGILIVFLGIVAYARLTGYWHTEIPDAMYFELIPRAKEFGHP
jgi:polyferredoxin